MVPGICTCCASTSCSPPRGKRLSARTVRNEGLARMESQCPVAIFVFDLRLDLALGPAIRRVSQPPENLGSKFSSKGLFDVGAKLFFARGIIGLEGWPSGLRHRS